MRKLKNTSAYVTIKVQQLKGGKNMDEAPTAQAEEASVASFEANELPAMGKGEEMPAEEAKEEA